MSVTLIGYGLKDPEKDFIVVKIDSATNLL